MTPEIRNAAGPYDVVIGTTPDGRPIVAVPSIVDAMANLRAAGFTTEIMYYERDDRENPTPW